MYAYIKGLPVQIGEDFLIIENQGVGYRLTMTPRDLAKLNTADGEVQVYTYLHVREDLLQLYGFGSPDGQTLFNTLITVSGVGPKLAMTLIQTLTPEEFVMAVLNEDIKTLIRAKGLGKKGAERLVLELRDKVKKLLPSEWQQQAQQEPAAAAALGGDAAADVTAALLVLGYNMQEADQLTKASFQPELSLEENLSAALRRAGK